MKKYPNRFILTGLIIAVLGLLINVAFQAVLFIEGGLEVLRQDLSSQINGAILEIVDILITVIITTLFIVVSVITLVRYGRKKPNGFWEVALLIISSMGAWGVIDNLISYFTALPYYIDMGAGTGSYAGYIFCVYFVFNGKLIQIIGFVLLLLGAMGLFLGTNVKNSEEIYEVNYEEAL